MCSLRLIKHSLKRSACCFFRCTSYFWGLECFRRWLVLRVGSLAELQHAGVYVESTELGGDGGRHELVILQRPASGFDQLGKSFKQIEAPLNVTFGDNLKGNKTRSGASFLDIENLISPSLFWYFVLSGVFGLPPIYDSTPTHSLRVVNERILVIVAVSDVDQVLNAVLLLLGFAALQERRHTTSSCCLYMTTFSWRD